MNHRFPAVLLVAGVLLAGCSGSGSDSIGPTDPTSGNGNPGTGSSVGVFHANFVPLSGVLPYPTDLYFSGSTDGTLNSPVTPFLPNAAAINALDGYSTNASATARFSAPIDPATVSAATVFMLEVDVDNATKATVGFRRLLVVSAPTSPRASPRPLDSGGATLEIVPLKPLTPSTGATNVGYLIVLTNGLRDTGGNAATPDRDYLTILGALPTCAAPHRLDERHLPADRRAARSSTSAVLGVPVAASVVLTFSFSTQATADTMGYATAIAAAGPDRSRTDRPQPVDAESRAAADRGRLRRAARDPVLPRPGRAAHRDPGTRRPAVPSVPSTNLTRFNPVPVAKATLGIPLFVTVPNAASGHAKPADGWPVVIFQHGMHGQPHAVGRGRGRLRFAGLRRRRDRHSAARHHGPDEPALPGGRRTHVRSRPRKQLDRRVRSGRRRSTRRARTSSI